MSRLIALFVLVGCQSDPVVVAPPRSAEPVAAPKPFVPAVVLLPYDESLDSPEEVAAWQADAIAKVDAYAALPDPDAVRAKYLPYFKVKAKVAAQPLGDARVWDAPAQKTRTDAAALEAKSEEYEAGRIYASLGDKDAVRRCSRKLADELEWAAVAKLAFLIGDEVDNAVPESSNWSVKLEDVFLFVRTDKARALELARTNVVDWETSSSVIVEGGEGCWAGPVAGTLDLYRLVKSDADLKAAYLMGVRSWPANFGGVGEVVTGCNLHDLGALLVRVRKLNDAELTKAWNDALSPTVADEAMVNGYRAILGLAPIVADADPFAIGTLSATDQKKLQSELGVGNVGSSEAIRAEIVMCIEEKVESVAGPKDRAGVALSNAVFVGRNALWTNEEADRARSSGPDAPRHVVPSTQEQLDAIMLPVTRELTAKGIPDFEPYVTTGL